MDKKLKDLLYRSFDSELSPEEKRILEQALTQSDELRREKEIIASLRSDIQSCKETSFNPNFVDRVMEKIHSKEQRDESEQLFDSLFVYFRPVAIAASILIIIIAGYNISTTGSFSLEGALGVPEVSVDDVYDPTLALVSEE
jgi:hypothetical protein